MKRILLAALTLSSPAFAQSKVDFALLGADAVVRMADVYTTKQDQASHCCRENILPKFIIGNQGRFIGFEAATSAGIWEGSRYLHRHHHPKLGDLATIADIVLVGITDWHNYELSKDMERSTRAHDLHRLR